MSQQLSVHQQNHATRVRIEKWASWYAQQPERAAWLSGVLIARGLDPKAGILVDLSDLPEPGGTLLQGMWLDSSHRFWSFEVLVPQAEGVAPEVEEFAEVTDSTETSAHRKGTGQTFGHIAIEVWKCRAKG